MVLACNMSWSEACTSSSSCGGMCLNCSLNSLLLVIQISCSTALVQPSSFPSNVKTSWKASTRSHATVVFRGVQLLRPSRSNFSRSFLCHSATDRGCCLSSAPRTASISGYISAGGTGNVETTLTTCMPFFRKIKDSNMFLTTTDTLLLLILSLVYACRTCNPGGRGHAPPPRLSFPSPQGCHHNMGTFTNKWFDPALQFLDLEWSQSNILFHEDWLVQVSTHGDSSAAAPCSVGPSPAAAAPGSSATVPCWLNKQDALTIAQGVESLSISLSLIMLMILPSVQVPIMIGTHWENSDSSDMTRKTMSLT